MLMAGSAGTVMSRLLVAPDAESLAAANDRGVAMQITNALRDVGQDLRRGRIYLREEVWKLTAIHRASSSEERAMSRSAESCDRLRIPLAGTTTPACEEFLDWTARFNFPYTLQQLCMVEYWTRLRSMTSPCLPGERAFTPLKSGCSQCLRISRFDICIENTHDRRRTCRSNQWPKARAFRACPFAGTRKTARTSTGTASALFTIACPRSIWQMWT